MDEQHEKVGNEIVSEMSTVTEETLTNQEASRQEIPSVTLSPALK